MDCAVSELRARNGRGRIPQSGGGQTVMYVLVGVVLQSMYCDVTQRLVPVPCLSLSLSWSLSVVVRCRRDLFDVAGGPRPSRQGIAVETRRGWTIQVCVRELWWKTARWVQQKSGWLLRRWSGRQ